MFFTTLLSLLLIAHPRKDGQAELTLLYTGNI